MYLAKNDAYRRSAGPKNVRGVGRIGEIDFATADRGWRTETEIDNLAIRPRNPTKGGRKGSSRPDRAREAGC